MDLLVEDLPSDWTAVAGFDSTTNIPFTNHRSLFGELFQHGVKDIYGKVIHPCEGQAFLPDVFDHPFARASSPLAAFRELRKFLRRVVRDYAFTAWLPDPPALFRM